MVFIVPYSRTGRRGCLHRLRAAFVWGCGIRLPPHRWHARSDRGPVLGNGRYCRGGIADVGLSDRGFDWDRSTLGDDGGLRVALPKDESLRAFRADAHDLVCGCRRDRKSPWIIRTRVVRRERFRFPSLWGASDPDPD